MRFPSPESDNEYLAAVCVNKGCPAILKSGICMQTVLTKSSYFSVIGYEQLKTILMGAVMEACGCTEAKGNDTPNFDAPRTVIRGASESGSHPPASGDEPPPAAPKAAPVTCWARTPRTYSLIYNS